MNKCHLNFWNFVIAAGVLCLISSWFDWTGSHGQPSYETSEQMRAETGATTLVKDSKAESEIDLLRHVPIETIRVGMRVPGKNPEVSDEERAIFQDPEPETWRLLRLDMTKIDGSLLQIEMLRPLTWIVENNANPGRNIFLNMPELGAYGTALVKEVGDCPPISDGPGQVVISTFAHPASHAILDIVVEGSKTSIEETISVTSTHPIWSVGHGKFVPAGELAASDQVQTLRGQTKRITSILPRPGPAQRVYNFEVQGEHVYGVGHWELLVHNECPKTKIKLILDQVKDRTKIRQNLIDAGHTIRHAAHHLIPVAVAKMKEFEELFQAAIKSGWDLNGPGKWQDVDKNPTFRSTPPSQPVRGTRTSEIHER